MIFWYILSSGLFLLFEIKPVLFRFNLKQKKTMKIMRVDHYRKFVEHMFPNVNFTHSSKIHHELPFYVTDFSTTKLTG